MPSIGKPSFIRANLLFPRLKDNTFLFATSDRFHIHMILMRLHICTRHIRRAPLRKIFSAFGIYITEELAQEKKKVGQG